MELTTSRFYPVAFSWNCFTPSVSPAKSQTQCGADQHQAPPSKGTSPTVIVIAVAGSAGIAAAAAAFIVIRRRRRAGHHLANDGHVALLPVVHTPDQNEHQ
jgi:hypothetical protein